MEERERAVDNRKDAPIGYPEAAANVDHPPATVGCFPAIVPWPLSGVCDASPSSNAMTDVAHAYRER